jgi:hypothetical protein
MTISRGLMGFNPLGLSESFDNISELEAKILNLDGFKQLLIKSEKSEDWEEKFKGIWNENKGQLAGVVSKNYLLIQHKQAFLPVLNVLRNTGLTDIHGSIDQDLKRSYLIINFRDERAKINIKLPNGDTDAMELSLYMKHGVDGSLALWGTIGGFRLICSNGMVVGNILGVVRKVHRGSVSDVLIERFYKELIDNMINSSEKLSDVIQRSFGEKIKSDILEALLYGLGFGRNYVQKILEKCIKFDEIYKWDLYNNITQFLTHELERASFQRRIRYLEMANDILVGDITQIQEKGKEVMAKIENKSWRL